MNKKIKDVINLSKNVKYSANKLMQTEDDFYIQIQGNQTDEEYGPLQPGPPLDIEFLPEIQFYFKLEIEEGSESPITIKLEGNTKNMIVYGSFHFKLPSITENEMYLKNP